MEDFQNSELGESIKSFLCTEEFKKPAEKREKEYSFIFHYFGKEQEIVLDINEKNAKTQKPLSEIIKENLEKRFENEITSWEKIALYTDATIAYEFVGQHFKEKRYMDSIACASRLEQDLDLIRKYCPIDQKTNDKRIRFTQKSRERAHIVWENPSSNSLLALPEFEEEQKAR
jgi:hypothetical protein